MAEDGENDGEPGPDGDNPDPDGGPASPGRIRRAVRWHGELSTANKFGLYGVLFAAFGVAVPLVTMLWQWFFPGPSSTLLVEQSHSICTTSWVVSDEDLADGLRLGMTDERQIERWEREGDLVRADGATVAVSLSADTDKPIEIRDLTITVVRRDDPVPGTFQPGGGCGGEGDDAEPRYLVVDLDTLPLHEEVPVTYLQGSEQQREAREAAEQAGRALTLPYEVSAGGYYSFFLVGRSALHDCDWYATLTWWDGVETHRDVIDDDGRPFRVTGSGE
ncbi:hypothetical protein [Streptomyces sp. 6N223]|uniref:hypothetical protein n=1 Tax=Streptomyces sp. 6N223 TaxID=3457412 RepID=UPI003FD32AF1